MGIKCSPSESCERWPEPTASGKSRHSGPRLERCHRLERSRVNLPVDSDAVEQDLVLLKRLRGGDPDAFSQLMNRLLPQIERYVYRLTRSREVTDDVVQETFYGCGTAMHPSTQPRLSYLPGCTESHTIYASITSENLLDWLPKTMSGSGMSRVIATQSHLLAWTQIRN